MIWFRRRPKGRHALGAAVTSIPSRPLGTPSATAPAPVPSPAQPLVPRAQVLAVVASVDVVDEPVVRPVPERVLPRPVDVEPVVVEPVDVPPAPPLPARVPSVPVQALPPMDLIVGDVPPTEAPAVLASQSAPPPPVQPVPAPAAARMDPSRPFGPRVELGFADGSLRVLDPQSPTAQALSELVGELTSKDAASGQGSPDSRR
jgi:hypothetical protein